MEENKEKWPRLKAVLLGDALQMQLVCLAISVKSQKKEKKKVAPSQHNDSFSILFAPNTEG